MKSDHIFSPPCIYKISILFQFIPRNHHPLTLHVAKETILHGRELRFQSFNQYRKRFGLAPYKSFIELAGRFSLNRKINTLGRLFEINDVVS